MGIFAILLALVFLIYLSFRGVSVLILAPLLAMGMVFISGDIPVLYALTGPFMETTANYIGNYFPIFLGGAIFGKIMGDTGAAEVIAHFISRKLGSKQAVLAVVLATSLLTYGGVSLFVVVFAIYPLGVALFKDADIPKRFLPAAIALGAFTFTMTALPGLPQYLNSMPTNYLNTNIYAAPVLGIIASLIMLTAGVLWLNFRIAKTRSKSEGYGEHIDIEHERGNIGNVPGLFTSILPIIVIFVLNWLMVNIVFKQPEIIERYQIYGGINGNWTVTVALAIAIVLCLILFRKQINDSTKLLAAGANSSLAPIFNTAAIVGFGGVVKVTAAFAAMKAWILNLSIPGLYKVAISTSLISGIVGSSSGGTGTLEALSNDFLNIGLHPEAIHRVMLIAAGGLDTLPHCGAVITLLAVYEINHREGYLDVGMLTVFFPVLSAFIIIVIHLITGLV